MTNTAAESGIRIEDLTIEGPYGSVPVRTYLPATAKGGLVWVHGGAFAFGDIDQPESDWVARQLADRDIAVVAVDYRLAPVPEWASAVMGVPVRDGAHFPVASEEVAITFLWATGLLPDLPPERWSLGGASAGANLSVGAALRLRDSLGRTPHGLLLSYGLFHAELPTLAPELERKYAALPSEAAVFTPEVVHLIALNYVGDPASLTSPYAFAGGHDLSGLPSSFLLNADIDSLRASGDLFGEELAAAGVDVITSIEDGTTHGYLDDPAHPGAARSIERMAGWLLR